MTYDLPDELVVSGTGPVRTLTLNRPDQRNAINDELHHAFADVWRQLQLDEEARVVIGRSAPAATWSSSAAPLRIPTSATR